MNSDRVAVRHWLDEQYPEITRRARTEVAKFTGVMTALVNTDVRWRCAQEKNSGGLCTQYAAAIDDCRCNQQRLCTLAAY